jgi:glycosyltransferase involved in cell wall biosynthesis
MMTKRVRVCINGITENSEIRGPVRYIYELVAHLDTTRFEIFLLAGEWQRKVYGPLEDRVEVLYFDIGLSKASRSWFFIMSMPKLLRTLAIDVYHITFTDLLPAMRWRAKIVSTIHDSAEFVVPQRYSWFQAKARRLISKLQAHGSDEVITVSEASKADLVKYLGIDPARVTVTHLGASTSGSLGVPEVRKASGDETPYVLYVGVLENAKNVDRLVAAYAALAGDLRERFHLYLVGRKANAYARIRELIEEHNIGKQIKIFGYVEEQALNTLYAGATVFAYLSEYEGFGLPVLEAMQRGLPVLTANRSSLPEVAGSAAMVVETDIPSITRGLDELLRSEDLRRRFAELAIPHAASFDWNRTARQTEQVYLRALFQGSSPPSDFHDGPSGN